MYVWIGMYEYSAIFLHIAFWVVGIMRAEQLLVCGSVYSA